MVSTSPMILESLSRKLVKDLDRSFRLSVRLRVKGTTKPQSGTQGILKAFPKFRRKSSITIRYYRFWHPMESYYVLYIQLCQSVHRICHQNGNEVSSFSELVNNYPYRIVIRGTSRQSGYKVHCDLFSFLLWDL